MPEGLAAEVLAFVRDRGATHPRDLAEHFGRERALNGWGSWSAATTRALQPLHYYGLLRVAHRQDGIHVYAAAPPHEEPNPEERTRQVVLLVTRILAPLPERSLRFTLLLSRGVPDLSDPAEAVRFLWHQATSKRRGRRRALLWPHGIRALEAPRTVRLLAPFDPLVWDRRRFAWLWDWETASRLYAGRGPSPRLLRDAAAVGR